MQFDVDYPERLSRWLWLVKWLLAIPHFLILFGLGIALGVTGFIAWWAIFFTAKYPEGLWNFAIRVHRWSARVTAYLLLLRDEYPPFAFDADYPARLDATRPPFYKSWRLFLTAWALIPILVVYFVYLIGLLAVALVVPWIILFTGRYPRALFDFTVGVARFGIRLQFYVALLSDTYPPFGLR